MISPARAAEAKAVVSMKNIATTTPRLSQNSRADACSLLSNCPLNSMR